MKLILNDFKINENEPVGKQIHRFIRQQIVFANLLPGTLLSEAKIAKSCSLSRQPVREAFIKLGEENLVLIRSQRGTLVKKISVKMVMDGRFIRESVEADIVKILAAKGNKSLVKRLKNQLKEQRKVDNKDGISFLKLDEFFHRTLAESAGKTAVWAYLESIKAQMDRVRFLHVKQSDNMRVILQHEKVVEAIEKEDADLAEKAMRSHLQKILFDLPEMEKTNPEFFEG